MPKERIIIPSSIMKLAKGTGIDFSGKVTGALLAFLYTIFLARTLKVEELGLYYLAMSLIAYASGMATLGMHTGMMHFVPLYKGAGDMQRLRGAILTALGICTVLGLFIMSAVFWSSPFISSEVFNKPRLTILIQILCFSIPIYALATILLWAARGCESVYPQVIARDIGEKVFRWLFYLAFLFFGLRLMGVILANVAAQVLVVTLAFIFLHRLFPFLKSPHKPIYMPGELAGFSIPAALSAFLLAIMTRVDILMLGYFVPADKIGIYTIASQIVVFGAILSSSFYRIFGAMVSNLYNKAKIQELEDLFKTTTRWAFTLILPFFCLVLILAKPILALIGKDFIDGWSALSILASCQLIHCATGPKGWTIVMSGRPRIALINNGIVALTNIILNFIFIPKYGITGAALATGTYIILVSLIQLIEIVHIIKIKRYSLKYLNPIFADLLASIVLILTRANLLKLGNLAVLSIATPIYIVVYISSLSLLGLEKEEWLIFKQFKSHLLKTPTDAHPGGGH